MKRFEQVKFLKSVGNPAHLEECCAEVAFVGRSNVGKSSVLNAVCGKKKLAFTSQVPGKTRTISVYLVAKGRWIVDLPGYGFAVGPAEERAKWQAMIEGYLLNRPSLRMVFVLVDAKVGPTKLDTQMVRWLQTNGIPCTVIANKCDQVAVPRHVARHAEVASQLNLAPELLHWVSAAKGTGIQALEHEVAALLALP